MRWLSREVIPELEWWSVTRLRGKKRQDEGGRQGYMRHIRDSWKYVSCGQSGTEQKSRVSSSTAELPLHSPGLRGWPRGWWDSGAMSMEHGGL